jgi:hypothetical protein
MPLPGDHIVARFIRSKDWSREEHRPKHTAFKQQDLSLWSKSKLNKRGDSLDDVHSAGFQGTGIAFFSVDACHQLAEDAATKVGQPLQITVEWQPNGLPPHLVQWAYAHAEVRWVQSSEATIRTFRQLLALNYACLTPPAS